MDKNKQHRSVLYIISLSLIYCLALFSIYPPLRALQNYNQITSICLLIYVIVVFIDNPSFLLNPDSYRLAIFFFLLYTITISAISGNEIIANRYIGLAQIPIYYLAYQKNKEYKNGKDNLLIIIMISPFIILTCITTLSAYGINPNISRLIKAQNAMSIKYMLKGIGGYDFIYFLVILFTILLYQSMDKNRKLKLNLKILYSFILILISVLIVLSNFSTALFLTILSIIFYTYLKYFKNKKLALLIIAIVLVFFEFFQFMLNYIAQLFGNSLNANRILEIENYLFRSISTPHLDSRFDVWWSSLNAFIKYPMLGLIADKQIAFTTMHSSSFGQHSFILDTFALFGLCIGILLLYILLKPLYIRIKNVEGSYVNMSIVVLFQMLFLFLFNNATPSLGLAIFFVFPTVYDNMKCV